MTGKTGYLILLLCGALATAACGGSSSASGTEQTMESGSNTKITSENTTESGSNTEITAENTTESGNQIAEETEIPEENSSEVEESSTVLTTAHVNVRSGPSTESESLGKLAPGTEVERISDDGEWSTVSYEGGTAYIASEYLYDPSAEIPPLAHPAEVPTEPGWIFNTQMNENNQYRGGEQGDQTGTETRIEAWPEYYSPSSYPWKCLLRCKDAHLAEAAVEEACAAAANDSIGYDSGDLRLTFWDEVQKTDFDASLVETPCAANCVTSLLTIYKCAGERLGIDSVAELDVDGHVYSEEEILVGTGFFERVDDADLHSPDANHAGDVYIAESHTILQLTDGADVR